MGDIERELGAELIRLDREGKLNGQGGRLVRQARIESDAAKELEDMRRAVKNLELMLHLPNAVNLPKLFQDTAAKYKTATEHKDGSGI